MLKKFIAISIVALGLALVGCNSGEPTPTTPPVDTKAQANQQKAGEQKTQAKTQDAGLTEEGKAAEERVGSGIKSGN